jgi:hypothetical protein
MIINEPNFRHGPSGYRARCRCTVCTEGHRAAAAASRASDRPQGSVTPLKRVPDLPPSDTAPEPSKPVVGPWEAKAAALVDELDVAGAEADLLEVQALAAAALADSAVREGRSHRVAPAYRIMTEALNRLKAMALTEQQARDARSEDGSGSGSGIPRSLLDDPAFSFLRTCKIGWFPKNAAGEYEAVQRICALRRGHEGPHEGNPEEGRAPQYSVAYDFDSDSLLSMENLDAGD